MNPERWARLQDLFAAALERPEAERTAFLERACADDAALRAEIASLLAAHTREGAAGTAPDAWLRAKAPLVTGADGPLERIGPYRVVREIGAGGMGRVYLAERDDTEDPQFRQRVAVKLARADLASPHIEARFLRERRVLANLTHPNIARLLDGGTTGDGRPYFVMEYVEGRPIDVHCDAERLDVDACLALFQDVCAAVQHAHTHLVVHRDLKASNILVTPAGQVKLLDFGVAKLLQDDTEGRTARTQTATAWMTPDYASPEQVRGAPVTTATDVYSLGVLLYRLLGGRAPYALAGKTPSEIERLICDTQPPRPSTGVGEQTASLRRSTTERLRARLAGDLDTIVMKALHKEPAKRYGSAAEFAEDLERHRRGLPVRARPDTAAYRLRKFVARNRVPVGAGALVFLALVAGVIGTATQANVARQERDRARIETSKAERAATFLADLFRVEEGAARADKRVTALELIDRGAARLHADTTGDPEARAGMMSLTANVYMNLGFYDRARTLSEQAYAIRTRSLPAGHPELAKNANELANILNGAGDYAGAEARAREALALCRAQREPDHATIISATGNVASTLHAQRKLDEAEPFYREAITLRRAAVPPDSAGLGREIANFAALLSARGEHDAADTLLREAVAVHRARADGELDLSHALNNLGTSLIRRKLHADAEVHLREALAIRERLYGPEHPETGITLNNLGSACEWQDKLSEAEVAYRRSLDIKVRRLGREHASVATSLNNLAGCRHKQGALDEARVLYLESIAIRRKAYGPKHPNVATALANLARVYQDQNDRRRAIATWREALEIRELEGNAEQVGVAREALAKLGAA